METLATQAIFYKVHCGVIPPKIINLLKSYYLCRLIMKIKVIIRRYVCLFQKLFGLNWFATKHTQYSPFGEVFKASVLKEMVPGNWQYIRLSYFYTS